MSKRAGRSGSKTRSTRPATRSIRAVVPSAGRASRDAGAARDRLARVLEMDHLARVVPHLAPETLHQLIRYRGLDACGELVACATPEQVTSVLDLDLWRSAQPGRDEQFDEERFGEWIELLVDAGDSVAARIVAGIDEDLVIAGLSRYIRVFDSAAVGPVTSDGEPLDVDAPFSGLECAVGGYVVRARRTDAWDAIVALLRALDADHAGCFHEIMRGCRRLSNSTPEIDGLDDLLTEPAQRLYDVALERDDRRSRQGYSTPADARAFLEMARRPQRQRSEAPFSTNPIAAAYFRAAGEATSSAGPTSQPDARALEPPANSDAARSIGAVVDLLAEAGLATERPRALLEGRGPGPSRFARMRPLMEYVRDTDEAAYLNRTRELAFLANALAAGCSVQSRAFTPREASDAAVGVCNLGLEHWPARWPEVETRDGASAAGLGPAPPDAFLVDHDLVTAFEVGWAVLHEDVSLFVAERLVGTLSDLRSVDPGIQNGLRALRHEIARQRDAGTPWRARGALDVIATLDTPVWVSLLGLLDECPVLPETLTATLEGRAGAVSATKFEFISTTEQIGEVRAFMGKLLDILIR